MIRFESVQIFWKLIQCVMKSHLSRQIFSLNQLQCLENDSMHYEISIFTTILQFDSLMIFGNDSVQHEIQ